MSIDGISTYQAWIKYMSKRETSADATGWKRGEKGFGKSENFAAPNYKKDLLQVKAVGQVAQVGDGGDLKQRGY